MNSKIILFARNTKTGEVVKILENDEAFIVYTDGRLRDVYYKAEGVYEKLEKLFEYKTADFVG